jgi:hypothetical protein
VAVAALHGSRETMTTALRETNLLGKTSNALGGIVTKTVANPQAFVPKSPGGLCSEAGIPGGR